MSKNSIWIGEKDLNRDEEFLASAEKEFGNADLLEHSDNLSESQANRRDFLKFLGFGLGAATVAAGCDIPVKRAIPYVIKPDEIVPGVATYYASTYIDGGDFCPVLVKTREGRPIKIEGNDLSPITKGGTSARAQASVLDLYDYNRVKSPKKKTTDGWSDLSWNELDNEVQSKLASAKNIAIVTKTVLSPTAHKALEEFSQKYASAQIVKYDAVSSAAILEANELSFGDRVIPNYSFDKADIIVSFDADFLGTWISPIEFARQYAAGRKIDVNNPTMSRHIQVESHMSPTGSNADNRVLVKPSELGASIAYLHAQITGGSGGNELNDKAKSALNKVAEQLMAAKGKSLIVSGSNNFAEQILINDINNVLGNYGKTLSFKNASLQRQGNEKDLDALISRMEGGLLDAVIVWNANPAYDYRNAAGFASAMDKVETKVALSYYLNETTSRCDYFAPTHHYLESWGDAEAKRGMLSLIQPTIRPLFNTRQDTLSLLTWAESANINADSDQPYLDYLKAHWEENYFAQQSEFASFRSFWDTVLHDGVLMIEDNTAEAGFNVDLDLIKSKVSKPSSAENEIVFFEPPFIGNGEKSTNPWLQEAPDTVARTSWGNYLAVPVDFNGLNRFVGMNNLKDGDLVNLTIAGETMTLPVIQQFGMMPGTIGLALGYGRKKAGKCGTGVGVDVNPFVGENEGMNIYYNDDVTVSGKVGEEKYFSCVQYHHTMGVEAANKEGEVINADEAALAFAYGATGYQGALTERSIIYTSNINELNEQIEHMTDKKAIAEHLNDATLYPYDEYNEEMYSQGHHWGMHVDLNACIGCNACTVACMAENNVPVVGKKEVSRHHEMTWLRIDRYYYGDAENPNTVYQPLMCQHCDNAPCENVCPVNATNHSSEGLNQMAYNRCVGTRYCANNCPYKVRRFNWLDYTTADIFPGNQPKTFDEDVPFGAENLTRMVLNPDVTVRARGVIEKCSFCVQRIQEGKLTAKAEGRKLRDSDVKSACQTACPTGAITFGDRNNKSGELYQKFESPLNYTALEEVNVRSSVRYTMKVNNKDESLEA